MATDAPERRSIHDGEKAAESGMTSDRSDANSKDVDLERAKPEDVAERKEPGPPKGPPGIDPASFPDGGTKAWLTVLGGFCCLFVSFGWINAIGVFQEFYSTDLLRNYSPSTVAWIVSLESFFMFFGGPIIGPLYDSYGPRWILLAGTLLHVFGLMMASLGTDYYQILLAQGICSPIGASCIFYPAVSATQTWFLRRRALALGIVASGSSLGGVIFPIMVQRLLPQIGFAWSMRAAAFLILGLLVIANLTVTSRLEHTPKRLNPIMLFKPLRELPFALLVASSFFIFLGLFLPFAFITLTGIATGMDPYLASYLIPVLNAVSIFGRILPGYLADKFGRFNIAVTMCYVSGIICLAIWLPAQGSAPTFVFAALYGFGSGTFVSIVPALVAAISDIRQIGLRTGCLFMIIAPAALVGNPIGGALQVRDNGGFRYVEIFAGVAIIVGTTFMFVSRGVIAHWKIFKKL